MTKDNFNLNRESLLTDAISMIHSILALVEKHFGLEYRLQAVPKQLTLDIDGTPTVPLDAGAKETRVGSHGRRRRTAEEMREIRMKNPLPGMRSDSFAVAIRAVRGAGASSMSQGELAKAIGMDVKDGARAISRIEMGGKVTREEFRRICDVLGMSRSSMKRRVDRDGLWKD